MRISYQQLMGDMPDEDIVIPVKRKRKKRPEDLLQMACIKWLRLLGRSTRHAVRFIVAQPDAMRALSLWQQQKAKDMGQLGNAGHPEIIILDTRKSFRLLLIELKAEKGRMSDAQLEWEAWCKSNGIEHYVIRGVDELQRAVG